MTLSADLSDGKCLNFCISSSPLDSLSGVSTFWCKWILETKSFFKKLGTVRSIAGQSTFYASLYYSRDGVNTWPSKNVSLIR